MPLKHLNLIIILTIFSTVSASLFADYKAPKLDKKIPQNLEYKANFKPKDLSKKSYLGFRRNFGVLLKTPSGINAIYVSESHRNTVPNNAFMSGDIIMAVNGKAFSTNAQKQFWNTIKASTSLGYLWITRWRKGNVKRLLIDLGTRPLDLTKSKTPGNTHDWRLGPLGASGWCFHQRTKYGATLKARQILITTVDQDGPSKGILKKGDVLLGIKKNKFHSDARKMLALAINEAEKDENKGKLELLIWRDNKETQVIVTLPVLGSYSQTSPFECQKTERIIENAVSFMKKNQDKLLKPEGWINYVNGLGLLATGHKDAMPLVKKMAHGSILKEGEELSVEKHVSMMCWWWSYKTIFLCEYYLLTKDEKVLPTIERYATIIAMGQSGAGTWGHTYAAKENTGYLHGHLGGYGAINQMGLTMMIALPLAKKCGVQNKEVLDAIKRGDDFFSYFIGKGTIPYGDHGAANGWYDDNGKSGAAAIFFDLLNKRDGTSFFSDMVLASTPGGRESGHTGHYWSHLWGGLGAAKGGEKSLQAYMKEMDSIFTLERQPEGRFAFQENAGESGKIGDKKTKWDCTGTRLLQLCYPKRILYITGKETPKKSHLTDMRLKQILKSGKLIVDADARKKLSLDEILELLKDPLPPTRAMAAKTLAERNINCVRQLIELLDSNDRYARYGAAEALCKAGYANKKAADKLIQLMENDDDLIFKSYAIDSLINRDTKKGLLTVAKPAIPVLLRMAVKTSPDDPRQVLQQHIALALFYKWSAQPRKGLLPYYGVKSAPKELLIPAMKQLLNNQNGGTRSLMRWVYPELTSDEIKPLWKDIYVSTKEIAPSGIMFASEVRLAGLKALADHRIKEGLDLAAYYIRYVKPHGGPGRIPHALNEILKYEGYARDVIPELKKYIPFWEAKRRKNRPVGENDPANLIRETIKKINSFAAEPKFDLVSISDQLQEKPEQMEVIDTENKSEKNWFKKPSRGIKSR